MFSLSAWGHRTQIRGLGSRHLDERHPGGPSPSTPSPAPRHWAETMWPSARCLLDRGPASRAGDGPNESRPSGVACAWGWPRPARMLPERRVESRPPPEAYRVPDPRPGLPGVTGRHDPDCKRPEEDPVRESADIRPCRPTPTPPRHPPTNADHAIRRPESPSSARRNPEIAEQKNVRSAIPPPAGRGRPHSDRSRRRGRLPRPQGTSWTPPGPTGAARQFPDAPIELTGPPLEVRIWASPSPPGGCPACRSRSRRPRGSAHGAATNPDQIGSRRGRRQRPTGRSGPAAERIPEGQCGRAQRARRTHARCARRRLR
jgi:hypothetical protein